MGLRSSEPLPRVSLPLDPAGGSALKPRYRLAQNARHSAHHSRIPGSSPGTLELGNSRRSSIQPVSCFPRPATPLTPTTSAYLPSANYPLPKSQITQVKVVHRFADNKENETRNTFKRSIFRIPHFRHDFTKQKTKNDSGATLPGRLSFFGFPTTWEKRINGTYTDHQRGALKMQDMKMQDMN